MSSDESGERGRVRTLVLGALGVVYGDIGTSPVYTLRECLNPEHGVPHGEHAVYGVLSLIFWSLILTVTVKYVVFVMRADNRGEGGILALKALTHQIQVSKVTRRGLLLLGLAGAALFYGDGMITPAISVLSAVEGMAIYEPRLAHLVLPLTVGIILAIFMVQKHGTAQVGRFFGPVMTLWFIVLGLLGLGQIVQRPDILQAVLPHHAIRFMVENGWAAFATLGSVVLAVTGGEALYADMGHFGRRPIRLAWFGLVLPSLLLNYFGQGALVLAEPEAIVSPFYHMAPDWALLPLVILTTCATVIASQAVISGAFSLTRQAMQLGYAPRMVIVHTSSEEVGQIYVPAINWGLLVAVLALVLGFKNSGNLASAYGIAVTGTMAITTMLSWIVVRRVWNWGPIKSGALILLFLFVDLAFFSANLLKVADGGWFPLAMGAVIFLTLMTWVRGRLLVQRQLRDGTLALDRFLARLEKKTAPRVAGTAVFLTGDNQFVPQALLHNFKHNKVLHENVVLLTVKTESVPHIPKRDRVTDEKLTGGFRRIVLHYGFAELANVPKELEKLSFDVTQTSFFVGRTSVMPSAIPGMALWREKLFAIMARNAVSAADFFCIPPNRVVELGTQVEI